MSIQDERLYYDDSYKSTFKSEVAAVRETDESTWVRLAESAFYPTSGGQPYDTGWLGEAKVMSVEADADGVWHKVDKPLPVGEQVTGRIDFDRRFDFMQQHSGQHVLSACFEQLLNVDTVSFHMGNNVSTIDLDIPHLGEEDLQRIELAANEWIWRDVPIRARFVTAEELATLRLRKPPKVDKDIRIVTIEGLEDNACGGTHPSSTGQIGQILITKTERMRGQIRVSFVCGTRALRYGRELVDVLRTLSTELSVGLPELITTVTALQEQLKDSRKQAQELKQTAATLMARDVADKAMTASSGVTTLIADIGTGYGMNELKPMMNAVAELLESRQKLPYIVTLLGREGEREFALSSASEGAPVAANALVQGALTAAGGKGGGNPKVAQGSAPWNPKLGLSEVFLHTLSNLLDFEPQ